MTAALPSLAHKFTDGAIVWERGSLGIVRAIFCTVEVGCICTEPAEHHEGMLVRFGSTRFSDYARDEAEARAWIEHAFAEWVDHAADARAVIMGRQRAARRSAEVDPARPRAVDPVREWQEQNERPELYAAALKART